MYTDDLVSIITPAYNAERFIEDTILSVINQTYSDWEMIIIDDCSSDKTRQIVEKYSLADTRIVLLINEENLGVSESRNKGIKSAKGRFLAFLDSDDQWVDSKLFVQINYMKNRNIGFTFSSYKIFVNSTENVINTIQVPKSIKYRALLKNTIIGCLTVVIDRKIIEEVYFPDIRISQDFVAWVNVLKKGYIAYGINEPLALYRKHQSSLSGNKKKAIVGQWKAYRNTLKFGYLKSIYYFLFYLGNAFFKHNIRGKKNV